MSEEARTHLRSVEVLYFDVFGTVVDYVETVTSVLRTRIASTSLPDPALLHALQHSYDWRYFTIKWREQYKLETQRLASNGNPDKITVDQMHMAALNRLISALPVEDGTTIGSFPVEEVSKELDGVWGQDVRERLNFTWHLLEPWSDSVEGLQKLRSKFKIGALTNGNLDLMVDMAKNGRLPWDFLLTADTLGSFKPDPQMYEKAMRLFGIEPDKDGHRACMVAAHLYDLEAAKACGMTTVFVSSRPTEDQLPAEGKPAYVDIVVADLLELAQLIR